MTKDQALSYSVEGAAQATASTRTRIYQAIASGDLASYKDGRRRRITRRALEEYVARLERDSRAGEAA